MTPMVGKNDFEMSIELAKRIILEGGLLIDPSKAENFETPELKEIVSNIYRLEEQLSQEKERLRSLGATPE